MEVTEDGVKRYEGARLLIRPSSLMNLDIDDVSCTEDEGCDADDGVFADELSSPIANLPAAVLARMKGDLKVDADKAMTPALINGNWSGNNTVISVSNKAPQERKFESSLIDDTEKGRVVQGENAHNSTISAATVGKEDEDMDNEDTDGDQTPTQTSSVEDIVREFSTEHSFRPMNRSR